MPVMLEDAIEKLQAIVDPAMVEYMREETAGITPPTQEVDTAIAEVYPQLLLDHPQLTDREKLDLMGLNWMGTAKGLRDELSGYIGLFYCPGKEKLAEVEAILLAEPFTKFREKLEVSCFLVAYPKPGHVWHYWDFDSFMEICERVIHHPDPNNFPALLSVELR